MFDLPLFTDISETQTAPAVIAVKSDAPKQPVLTVTETARRVYDWLRTHAGNSFRGHLLAPESSASQAHTHDLRAFGFPFEHFDAAANLLIEREVIIFIAASETYCIENWNASDADFAERSLSSPIAENGDDRATPNNAIHAGIAESSDTLEGENPAAPAPDSAITPGGKKPKSTIDLFQEKGWFPGGKANVYHTIINQMPNHKAYVELFAGNAAIARRKNPSFFRNVLVDADSAVCEHLREDAELKKHFLETDGATQRVNLKIVNQSALEWIDGNHKFINEWTPLIYADPPYLKSTRLVQNPLYSCEFWSDDEHRALLEKLIKVSDANTFAGWRAVKIIVSGYQSELYDELLKDWRRVDFTAYDRAGNKRTESLWCNFPEPDSLHDYQYLGANFRERERIKRQQTNWKRALLALPAIERNAMMHVLGSANAAENNKKFARADIADSGDGRSETFADNQATHNLTT